MTLFRCKKIDKKLYYLLDYIKSPTDKYAYITISNNDIQPTFTIKASMSINNFNTTSALFCIHMNNGRFAYLISTSGKATHMTPNMTYTIPSMVFSQDTKYNFYHEITSNNSAIGYDSTQLDSYGYSETYESPVTLYIGSTWSYTYKSQLTIYNLEIDNIINLIPCQEKSTGLNGMYDKISNTFFSSAKSNFIAGNIIGEF